MLNFETLFESLPGLYLILDSELKAVAMSDAYAQEAAICRDDVIGRVVIPGYPGTGDDLIGSFVTVDAASIQKVLRTCEADTQSLLLRRARAEATEGAGSHELYWRASNSPVLDSNGSIAWIIHRLEDVTELVRLSASSVAQTQLSENLRVAGGEYVRRSMEAEKARQQVTNDLRASERRERERSGELGAILDALPTPVFIMHDAACLHITGNPAADEFLKLAKGAEASLDAPVETRPRHFKVFKDGRELKNSELPPQLAARGQRVREFELRFLFDDGTTRDVLAYGEPLWNHDGTPRGGVTVLFDITERKRIEQALRNQAAVQCSILDAIPACVALLNSEGNVVLVNRSWQQFSLEHEVGHDGRAIKLGDNYLDACQRAVAEGVCLNDSIVNGIRAVLNKALSDFSAEYLCQYGEQPRWYFLDVRSIAAESGGTLVLYWDVTERHMSNLALLVEKERLLSILNTAADAIILIDSHGMIELVNPAAEKMFGYTAAEMLGNNVKMLMPTQYEAEHDDYLRRYIRTGRARVIGVGREVQGRRKDGSVFPIDLAVSAVNGSGHFTGVLRDISERKQLQRQVLEISSDEKRRIGQELHDGIQQELTGLSYLAGAMRHLLIEDPPEFTSGQEQRIIPDGIYSQLCDTAEKISQRLSETNRNVRQLAHGIMPVQIDAEGLRSALEELAANTCFGNKILCRFECHPPVDVKNSTAATNLYRIAQEAVNNALRHGHASEIRIALSQNSERLLLEIDDNGKGFDSGKTESGGQPRGFGLRIMEYRAGELGGTLQVKSSLSGGTGIRCEIPLVSIIE